MSKSTWWAGLLAAFTLLSACGDDAPAPERDASVSEPDATADALDEAEKDASTVLPEAGAGACGEEDALILAGDDTPFESTLQSCVFPVVSGGTPPSDPSFANKVGDCLETKGLSASCAACYGVFAQCNASQCLSHCISDPNAPACVECRCGQSSEKDCIGALVACTGLPDDTCD